MSAGRSGTGQIGKRLKGIRANSCEVSRMAGQEDRKRSVAGCQGGEHTEPCLKPGRAPSTGAESGWVKGYKKMGGWEGWPAKKRRHAETLGEADCADHLKSGVCVGRKVARH